MVNIGIVGVGLVGSELLQQLYNTASKRFAVVGLCSSKKMIVSEDYAPIDLKEWSSRLNASTATTDLDQFAEYMSKSTAHAVIIDCTASDTVAQLYPSWLRKGVSVVTPNKKGFSGPLDLYKDITGLAANFGGSSKGLAYHESTVGAGLPVLATLSDLVKTGDRLKTIEGIFSGTLSFLFNNFSTPSSGSGDAKRFSEHIKVAKSLGYTEPDPRDDLNGVDVARKVTICGRLAGVDLDLSTLPVENIVPGPLQSVPSVDAFMEQLPEYDGHFSKLNEEAQAQGQVLRYVGMVDVASGTGSVKLARYSADHPFASLQGSDNIIKFTTEYFPNGLIIQGAGAGAAVTAFGIFSDLLKIQERVEL